MSTTILNLSNCGTSGNVGKFFCAFQPSIYKYFLMFPKGTVIPASVLTDNAALKDYIYDGLTNDTPGLRWKLSGILSQMQDNTEAVKTENKDGYLTPTQFPPYNWQWDMTLQFAQFAKWKQYSLTAQDQYDFAWVDDAGNLIGTSKTDADGASGLGGVSLFSFYMQDMKTATVDTLVKFNVNMIIQNNAELNESAAMVQANLTPQDWASLLYDTLIVQGLANTSTAIKVQVYTDGIGAKASLLAKFGTVLDAAGAWLLTKNGSTLTPSGVAYDSTNDQMVFTVSTLSSLDVVTVRLNVPSVLLATPYFCPAVSEGTVYTYTHP
jgi:hypothetical protein